MTTEKKASSVSYSRFIAFPLHRFLLRDYRYHLLVILAAVSLAYLNSFRGVFQFDDYSAIVNNSVVHSSRAWLTDASRGIRPVLKFSYMINWIMGQGTVWFHLFNVAIHSANCLLIFFLARNVTGRYLPGEAGSRTVALIVALLFALHPIQTEAVTYICGRSASLMALFYLASLLVFIRGTESGTGVLVRIVSPLLFLIAVLTKEHAVTLPVILLLWQTTGTGKQSVRAALRYQAVHWILLGAVLLFLLFHPIYLKLLEIGPELDSIRTNLMTHANGIVYLVSRLLMIHRLNIDPDLPHLSAWSLAIAVNTVSIVSSILVGILSLKKRPWLAFSLLWFFLLLVPAHSIISRPDVANERQMYLPVFGVFLMVGIMLNRLIRKTQRRKLVTVAIAFGFVILGAVTVARNHVYRSEVALWEDTQRKSPGKASVYNNLGCAYLLTGHGPEAQEAFQTALLLRPDYVLPRHNIAVLERYHNADRVPR